MIGANTRKRRKLMNSEQASNTKRNKAVKDSKIADKTLNKNESPMVPYVRLVDCAKIYKNIFDIKETPIKDNKSLMSSLKTDSFLSDKESVSITNNVSTDTIKNSDKSINKVAISNTIIINKADVSKSNSTVNNISADAIKNTDKSMNKERISNTMIINKADALKSNTAAVLPKATVPQAFSGMSFPSNVVFVKVDNPLKIFEHTKNVSSVNNNIVPVAVNANCYGGSGIRIVAVQSLNPQSTISQNNTNNNNKPNFQQKDQSEKNYLNIQQKDVVKKNYLNIQQKDVVKKNSQNTKSQIEIKKNGKNNQRKDKNSPQKAQEENMQPSNLQQQQSKNIVVSSFLQGNQSTITASSIPQGNQDVISVPSTPNLKPNVITVSRVTQGNKSIITVPHIPQGKQSVVTAPSIPQENQRVVNVLSITQGNQNVVTVPSIPQGNQSVVTVPSILKGNYSVVTVPSISQGNQRIVTVPSISEGNQSVTTEPSIPKGNQGVDVITDSSIPQENQYVVTASSIPQKNQDVVTLPLVFVPNSMLENHTNEILMNSTKFFPIKPKPPGYQGPKTLSVFTLKKKQYKPKNRSESGPKKQEKSAESRITEDMKKFSCKICGQKFFKSHGLLYHQKKSHIVPISTGKDCRVCGMYCKAPSTRYKHERQCHPGELIVNRPYYKCPECLTDFKGVTSIKHHFHNDHPSFNLQTQNIILNSLEEFEKWKDKVEKDSTSEFIKTSKFVRHGCKKIQFICHRSSPIQRKFKSSGKRQMKYKGSIKTGLYCPAFIIAKVSSAHVQVTFNLAHIGHECDIEHIKMKKRVKSDQNCKKHRCRVCNKFFTVSTNRRQHEQTVHSLFSQYEMKFKCPLCFCIFQFRKTIMCHLSKCHQETVLKTSRFTCDSLKEFEKWKSSMEQETASDYVFDLAYQKNVFSCRRFNCHLSGSGEDELYCPASILLKLNPKENSLHVTHVSTHVGHSIETVPVSSSENNSLVNDCIPIKDGDADAVKIFENFIISTHLDRESVNVPMSLLENNSVINNCMPIKDSHDEAVKILNNATVVQKDEITWYVLPNLNEKRTYEIKQLHVEPAHFCDFKCSPCNICSHQLTCNCSVSSSNVVCIHIHILCLKIAEVNGENDSGNSCLDVDINVYEQDDSNEKDNAVREIDGSHKLNSLKEQAVSDLSALLVEVENCNDETKLKRLISSLSNLRSKIS